MKTEDDERKKLQRATNLHFITSLDFHHHSFIRCVCMRNRMNILNLCQQTSMKKKFSLQKIGKKIHASFLFILLPFSAGMRKRKNLNSFRLFGIKISNDKNTITSF